MDQKLKLLKFLFSKQLISSIPADEVVSQWQNEPILSLNPDVHDEEQLSRKAAKLLGLDFIDLGSPEAKRICSIDSFTQTIAHEMLWKHRILPLYRANGEIVVAVANPLDQDGIQAVEFVLSTKLSLHMAMESLMLPLLARHFPSPRYRYYPGIQDGDALHVELVGDRSDVKDVSRIDSSLPPVIRLVNKIIGDAVKFEASDIHFEPNDRSMYVKFRIDGVMQEIIEIPRELQNAAIARCKVISGMDISERRRPQDGRLRIQVNSQILDLRLSTIPTASGEKLVIRLFHHDYESLMMPGLGIPAELESRLMSSLTRKGKMLLVTGPTGAGKTTTLYSCLNAIRDGKSNITTIEDPVEYRLPGLNQIQVNRSADVTFASALRSVLRQDPDVVMIGEIRDKETLEIALQAAQTGHLVLSTVHTNDAPSAISRLLALGGDPHLISTGLSGILAQRLLKKLCPDCAKAASPLYLKQHEDLFNDYSISQKSLLEPVGCEQCYELGYRGRIGIYSYLEMNDELAELVFTGASRESLSRAARRYGFRELDEAAVDLVNDAVVCLSEAKPYLQRKDTPASESLLDDLPNDHGKAVNPPIGRPSSTTPAPRPSVLIVDDNKFARKMLCAMLKDERVDIVQAENGRDALDKVFACAPAIILCDISMPEMDGRQFLEHMKRDKTTRDIPIIVLTADDCEHTELELFKLGAREFLSKRSAPELIAGRVRNVLNSR